MRILTAVLGMSCFIAVPLGAVPTTGRVLPTTHSQARPDAALTRALDFLAELDEGRILEKPYAERVLKETDVIRASDRYEGEVRDVTDMLRVLALWVVDRKKEALAAADAVTARGATMPEIYTLAIQLAAATEAPKAVDYLERADKYLVTAEQRGSFKTDLENESVTAIRRSLMQAKDKTAHARFAEGLLKFDWPGEAQFAHHDVLRMIALRGRLAKGDVAGARTLARQIANPSTALELLIVKDYDPLVEAGDRVARVVALVEAEEGRSARALKAKPDDLKLILARAQFMRSVGRDSEALALLLPRTGDMTAIEKGGIDAFWIVNETAYALNALNRPDEAIALMRRLLALNVEKHPDLINMAINLAVIMNRVGRHREAAAYAEDLFRVHADKASKYGQMWMWEAAACGHALGGNTAAAKPWLARLRAGPDDNRSALMLGLLCINELDGAAAQFLERLNGDDASDMLVAAQDYTIINANLPSSQILDRRLQQVVARPAVAAAIASKGRILKLPLSRTYWGLF